MGKKILFSILFLTSTLSLAGEIKYGVSIDLPEIQRKEVNDLVSATIATLEKSSLYSQKLAKVEVQGSNKGFNSEMDTLVLITTRKQAEQFTKINTNADSVTVALENYPKGPLVTFIFWDQIASSEKEISAKLATALANELFVKVHEIKNHE
jgi:hypothetical protein